MATNINQLIAELTPVKQGTAVLDVITSKRINAIQSLILGLVRGDNLGRSPGVRITKGPNGYTIKVDSQGRSGGGSSTVAERCFLELFDASKGTSPILGISYGSIANRHPNGFAAGGVPPFTIPCSGSKYVFVYGRISLRTRLFVETGIKLSTDYLLKNTRDTVYKLLGSAKGSNEDGTPVVTVAQALCGPVVMNPCETAA